MCLFIIDGDMILRQKRAQRRGDSVQQSGLEQTVPARQRPMAAARIKAGLNTAVPSEKQRILHLVPVALGLWRGKDVPHGHIQPADAAQGVRHEALLCRKLCFVGKVPETAAAAPAENRAVRRDAPGAGREDAFDDAKGVTFADFTTLTESTSPTAANGTKTAWPSKRPTPLPSLDSASMVRGMIWFLTSGI